MLVGSVTSSQSIAQSGRMGWGQGHHLLKGKVANVTWPLPCRSPAASVGNTHRDMRPKHPGSDFFFFFLVPSDFKHLSQFCLLNRHYLLKNVVLIGSLGLNTVRGSICQCALPSLKPPLGALNSNDRYLGNINAGKL